MNERTLGAVALAALTLAGCATRPAAPAEAIPAFTLTEDLAGRTIGRGRFSSITGADRAFTAELNGRMEGEVFVLVEDFLFEDGERDRKTWRLTPDGPGRWRGVREDVIGEAAGFQDGDGFRLEYLIGLPKEGGGVRTVKFRDVLVRTGEGVVVNRATVGYFGFRVGRVDLTITREAPAAP